MRRSHQQGTLEVPPAQQLSHAPESFHLISPCSCTACRPLSFAPCLIAASPPAAGAYVARLRFDLSGPVAPGELGCGPLRLWPGGLHMSRAIGDTDCGQLVIPHPYIQQVKVDSVDEVVLGCMLCAALCACVYGMHEQQRTIKHASFVPKPQTALRVLRALSVDTSAPRISQTARICILCSFM
jgi:hypothetical protein